MWRVLTLSALICVSLTAFAEDEAVDKVLKTGGTVSEDQLDATAESLLAQQSDKKLAAKAAEVKHDAAPKALSESQIPVFRDQHLTKATESSNWMRMIGTAVFLLVVAVSMFVAVKKMSKRRDIVGKKAKIDILHQHFLGPKKSLALIQVAGEAILIGITDHNINMIKPVALIDDELQGQTQDFEGFLEDEFTVASLGKETTPVKGFRTRLI